MSDGARRRHALLGKQYIQREQQVEIRFIHHSLRVPYQIRRFMQVYSAIIASSAMYRLEVELTQA
ncbi:hypothetical protein BN133_688 [Cronobacter dublinensis 582]|nr:hypothetical protein BN133_688 [Cronobacter dublinensis 582]